MKEWNMWEKESFVEKITEEKKKCFMDKNYGKRKKEKKRKIK